MDKLWLPEGPHWDLNIRHARREDAGPFVQAGPKLCHHTVESPRDFATKALSVLDGKRAWPHCIYGYDPDTRFPVVIQMIPFNRAGRALEHNLPPETNRANVIQIEICGRAADSGRWSDNYYKGLANLCRMIERRTGIPRRIPISFSQPRKFTPGGFVASTGHCGHVHVPGNSHTDPGTGFKIKTLFRFMEQAGNHGLELKPVRR